MSQMSFGKDILEKSEYENTWQLVSNNIENFLMMNCC